MFMSILGSRRRLEVLFTYTIPHNITIIYFEKKTSLARILLAIKWWCHKIIWITKTKGKLLPDQPSCFMYEKKIMYRFEKYILKYLCINVLYRELFRFKKHMIKLLIFSLRFRFHYWVLMNMCGEKILLGGYLKCNGNTHIIIF